MGRMSALAKQQADAAHETLRTAGLLKTSSMLTGAVMVADTSGNAFMKTENFNAQHVELKLLSHVFDYTKSKGSPFKLPNNSHVVVYVYHSPCEHCVNSIHLSLVGQTSMWNAKSPTTKWKFVFDHWYVGSQGSVPNLQAPWATIEKASKAYEKIATDSGGRVRIKCANTTVKPGASPRI